MSKDTKYRAEYDGLRWVLFREGDSKSRETGEVKRKEVQAGYYPKFHQAVAAMYEKMVADKLDGKFDQDSLLEAVNSAKQLLDFAKHVSTDQLKSGL